MKNYIGNNNEINKKKYKKSLPPKLNPDAGNVEYNIDMFNRAANVGDSPSSAAGMNGMAEAYDRENLIARIKEFGKNYKFDKYTDAQLASMLTRLVDKSNHRVKPKRRDTIDVDSKIHVMNDDPSYNFDDPDREGDYQVEKLTIRESLNRLDHRDIDEGNQFYDLRSLYEEIAHKLTPQEKQELKNLIQTTNDSDAIKAYIDSKDPSKKNEDLEEFPKFDTWVDAYKKMISIANKYIPDEDRIDLEIEKLHSKYSGDPAFDKAYEKWLEDHSDDQSEDEMISLDDSDIDYTNIDFDESLKESNDNLTYDELIDLAHKYYKQGGMEIIEFWDENSLKEYEKEFGPMTKKQAIRLMKVMGNVSNDEKAAGEYFSRQTYAESLNRREAEAFSRSIFNADSYETVDRILFELSRRDKKLAKTLRDMWDDSASVAYNTDILSSYIVNNLDIILHEDTVKQGNKWVNKGKEGTHGKFKTKKAADAQRKAMFANGYKGESLNEHILSENDLREAAKEYYDQVKKDIDLINKYPDILTDKYNSKESLISGLENDVIEPFELYDWIIATLNENNILMDESLEEAKKILYVIKDKNGNQLSRPSEDDSELWDRVASMEQRGRRGLKVVAYVPENMNEDFDPFDTYSLQDKIYDFLYFLIDDMDYEEMISDVSDEFGMSPDEAEKYVKAYINDSEVDWHDTADLEEDYDDYKSWTIEDKRKYKRLLIINSEGGNSAFDLEQLVKKYQPSAEDMEDLSRETIEKVYDELKDMYTKELQRYGKDHEVDLVALQALGLTGLEKKLAREDLQESTQTVYGVQYYENKLGKWVTYDYSSDKERIEYSYDQSIAGNPAKRMVELEISGTRKKKFKVLKTLKQTKNTWESLNRKNKRVVAYTPKDLEEDYTDVDDEWGAPYTYEETFDNLAELTNNFTDKDGYVRCYYEQEKIYGMKILKKYYKVVEPMDGRMKENEPMSWVISYSNPLNKDKEK